MTDGTMGLSAADVAAVTRNNDDDWGGGCWWIWIILLAFLFPMMGGWNRGGVETGVQDNFISDEFVKRDIFNTNQNVSNTACQTQRDVLENRYTNQLGLQQVQAAQQNCCCETQKEILQSRYDAALMAQNMQAQMAQCCCDIKESILADGNRHSGISCQTVTAICRTRTIRFHRFRRPVQSLMRYARHLHRLILHVPRISRTT